MAVGLVQATALRSARSRHRSGRAVLLALALCAVAVAWLTLAPRAVGGPASYVVTDGTSMLPRFHGDGLVITRAQAHYRVGEVVAYHNKELQSVVMHRIVGRDGARYVFKGDNNDFQDHYQPTGRELVGREWVYWPGAGRYLLMVRDPLTFAVIVALVALVSLRAPRRSRRRRHHRAW